MKYKEFLEAQKDNMMKELMDFVSINSVNDESTVKDGAPFGEGVAKALDFVAKLGEKYGFEVDRCDGYCTELTIGEGEKMIGIFAHADVVPATGEWDVGPFEPYIFFFYVNCNLFPNASFFDNNFKNPIGKKSN